MKKNSIIYFIIFSYSILGVSAQESTPSQVTISNNQVSLDQIPDFSLFVGEFFSYNVTARGGSGVYTFFDNASLFEINMTSGVIEFTPLTSDIGIHYVNISVSDGNSSDAQVVTFTIALKSSGSSSGGGSSGGGEGEGGFPDSILRGSEGETPINETNQTEGVVNESEEEREENIERPSPPKVRRKSMWVFSWLLLLLILIVLFFILNKKYKWMHKKEKMKEKAAEAVVTLMNTKNNEEEVNKKSRNKTKDKNPFDFSF